MGFESGWYEPPVFRWYVHMNYRHAVPRGLAGGQRGTTACGESVTVEDPEPKLGIEPECTECDRQWRLKVGIKPREDVMAGGGRPKINLPVTRKGGEK